LAQIASEVLKVPIESIKVITGDTEITPVSLGTWGSRVTYTGGNAVLAAARDLRRQLFAIASEMLETNIDDLQAKDGEVFVKGMEDRWVTIVEIANECFNKKGIPLIGRGYFVDKNIIPVDSQTGYGNPYPTWAFGCQAVEVEVDPETGKVSIIKVVAAHDLGKAINPMGVEGQIEGSVIQGIGYALFEELKWENGRIVNPNFRDYKLPTFSDLFPITTLLVESNDPDGPFGAKGVAEAGIVPTAAAVANAIYNAVGARINSLPITPEKILFALRHQKQT
jgi:CO/xanthine dehydrogenase Mo-binding subunit